MFPNDLHVRVIGPKGEEPCVLNSSTSKRPKSFLLDDN